MKAKTQIRAGLVVAGQTIDVSETALATSTGGPGAAIAVAVGVAVGNAIVVNPVIKVG